MNLKRVHLYLDPGAVARLTLLAEEQQITLVDLIRDVLDQHLNDVLHHRAQADAGEPSACAMPQDRAAEFDPLRAWTGMSPEARVYAAKHGLVQPPWAELEAAEAANGAMPV